MGKRKGVERKILSIPLSKLVINVDENVRKDFNNLDNLQDSLTEHGMLHPILVSEGDDGNYRVVAGFRRATAARNLKWDEIPATLHDGTAEDAKILQIIENLEREELSPYETATGLQKLVEAYGLTRDELAKRINKSNAWVSNYLGVFDLPDKVQKSVQDGKLGVGHIRTLHAQLKKFDEKGIIKHAENISSLPQEGVKEYFDKVHDRIAKKEASARMAKGDEKKAKRSTAIDTLAAEATAPDTAKLYDGMRTRQVVMDSMDEINTAMDSAPTTEEKMRLQGIMEAMMWVLGDEDIVLVK